jgi:PIN domain nuclease of toxin-antitoxin system
MFLLDTGVWFRTVNDPETLPEDIRELLQRENRVALSAISPWEIAKKVQKGKLDLRRPIREWMRQALNPAIELFPLSPEIAIESTCLENFHNDPADQIIVATCRLHDLLLLHTDTLLKDRSDFRNRYFKPLPLQDQAAR